MTYLANVTTCWSKFSNILDTNFTYTTVPISSPIDIEDAVNDLTAKIIAAHQAASKPLPTNNKTYLPPSVRVLITNRNNARKLWQIYRDPHSKNVYNHHQNLLKR
ncbi:hypothetical protein CEXT_535531 [Caerostris extrusa]|uniref:Uncharacterized protein n=1 Tax=Caerostris extrusa TaxID=172846 RepID=A0AAV4WN62_CAEEX|nr:hypothetical protein CEXT_535531 [Caerostris extrusa]